MKLQMYWQMPDDTVTVKPDFAGTENFVPAA